MVIFGTSVTAASPLTVTSGSSRLISAGANSLAVSDIDTDPSGIEGRFDSNIVFQVIGGGSLHVLRRSHAPGSSAGEHRVYRTTAIKTSSLKVKEGTGMGCRYGCSVVALHIEEDKTDHSIETGLGRSDTAKIGTLAILGSTIVSMSSSSGNSLGTNMLTMDQHRTTFPIAQTSANGSTE
jgi:hypothetical protein